MPAPFGYFSSFYLLIVRWTPGSSQPTQDLSVNSTCICPLLPSLHSTEGKHGTELSGAPSKDKMQRFLFFSGSLFICVLPPFQSLEPLPANGPDFGALGEEAEFVEVEPEAKQEILENKDVSFCRGLDTVPAGDIRFHRPQGDGRINLSRCLH